MRILLVEDDPSAAHVLAKGLREQAYAVDVAKDGEAAIFQAGTNDYDGVVLDLMLPLVDGVSVCRTIRASGSMVPTTTWSNRTMCASCWLGSARSSAAATIRSFRNVSCSGL